MFKKIITNLFSSLAGKLLTVRSPKVVVVTGSVGKTSTKEAIVDVLQTHYKVATTKGNFNMEVVVPLAVLGLGLPSALHSPLAWADLYLRARRRLKEPYEFDVVVLELGADHPGDLAHYTRWIKPTIAVVTGVSDEHLEFFKNVEAVAKEELTMCSVAETALLNRDDIDSKYDQLTQNKKILTYGLDSKNTYQFTPRQFTIHYGYDGSFSGEGLTKFKSQVRVVGQHNLRSAAAAVAVGHLLDVPVDKIMQGVEDIQPVPGRMNLLQGAEGSILIDDSYNSSPLAAKAALDTLYSFKTDNNERIAILGSMNELGEASEEAHKELGAYCDPSKLDWVVTVGHDANEWLAPAAESNGCRTKTFLSPIDAGEFVRRLLADGTVVLIKGSQNRVFTEEATKLLLRDSEDEKQLVRQSLYWEEVKRKQFSGL
ncbi:MAG TPA: UDP-N-acetylmuramoyl-tripeptide--D-alanyl-D-alanine ligase [Candidatus Saccharimonadales bacterium]|nr:UDP-N-acetylmuramoyl-tripeptide--D-alanyl-D-alanine ligase [Candidatus Saccharimonadales bacterium]